MEFQTHCELENKKNLNIPGCRTPDKLGGEYLDDEYTHNILLLPQKEQFYL